MRCEGYCPLTYDLIGSTQNTTCLRDHRLEDIPAPNIGIEMFERNPTECTSIWASDMDVFTTATTAGNMVLIYLEACSSYSDEARSLYCRFRWDLRVLEAISLHLKEREFQSYGNHSTAEDSLINETAGYLACLINKVSGSLAKIQASGFWGRTINQGLWVARRGSLKELEQELHEWTNRFDIRLLGLPPEIRDIIPATPVSSFPVSSTLSRASTLVAEAPAAVLLNSNFKMQQFAKLASHSKRQKVAQLEREPPAALLRELEVNGDGAMFGPLFIESQQYILATRPCPPAIDPGTDRFRGFKSDVGEFAAALHMLDPNTNICLLKVEYFFYEPQKNRFLFVHTPQHPIDEVLTLADMIDRCPYSVIVARNRAWLPLQQRLRLAQKLADAVFFLHTAGFVHKNINSSSIITLQRSDVPPSARFPYTTGDPYIMGFDMIRSNDGITFSEWAHSWENAITQQQRDTIALRNMEVFRHPDRLQWHKDGIKKYTKNHDIYSLGVILLQIGLWEPISTVTRRLERDRVTWPNRLCHISRDLGLSVGAKYQRVVTWCLGLGDSPIKDSDFMQEVLDPLENMTTAAT